MEIEPMAIISVDLGAVNDLSRNFLEKLSSASGKPKEGIQATIFRVPENIRRTNADSFEPKMVSLGPYHHGKQLFRATDERIKLPYASNFFRHTATGTDANGVQSIVELFKDWESDLRRAYSEQINMSSDEFVEMMLLDCAFMAEFLREQYGLSAIERADKEEAYSWKWAAPSIINDMLAVENQFPFPPLLFLLEKCRSDIKDILYTLVQRIHQNLCPTSKLIGNGPRIHYFGYVWEPPKEAHLLHHFHSEIVTSLWKKASQPHTVDLSSFPSAEMLQAMRMQFANKTHGESFLDITFDASKRSMEIPQLLINDDNISLLRNLIAFEQQCHGVGYFVSSYVWFMDCMINTDKDVAVLRKHNIIVSRLRSDEEVAHIFNELRRTDAPVVDLDHSYLAGVMKDVKSYSRNRWNRLCGLWNFSWLRQNYFRNRWVTIGVTVAICFNLLTLVQTVYAVLSYAKQ